MWKPVPPEEQPTQSKVTAAFKHESGYLLTAQTNTHSTLWELRDPSGRVITNQMDLPFKGDFHGAPITWANDYLSRKKVTK